jgi:hypothetical protein
MKKVEKRIAVADDLKTEIKDLKAYAAQLDQQIAEWIMWRKVEAGEITAQGLEQLDKAVHACNVVGHVMEDIKRITTLIAEVLDLPKVAELIQGAHGAKYDKQILVDLKQADKVAQGAVMFLLQAKDIILEADLKLKSTGWLSDRPPQIPKREQENELELLTNGSTPDEQNTSSESGSTETLEDLQSTHRAISNQRKNLKEKMRTRKNNTHVREEDKARQYKIDAAKLEDLTAKAQEIMSKIEKLSAGKPTTAANLYVQSTLRNRPADTAMPDTMNKSCNF